MCTTALTENIFFATSQRAAVGCNAVVCLVCVVFYQSQQVRQ